MLPFLLILAAADDYDSARAALEDQRIVLYGRLKHAKKRAVEQEIYGEARAAILSSLSREILPAWYGTRWAFNGTSDHPNRGEIACGIFVATVLEHAGFRLNRIEIGRLASERIALVLTEEENLRRYSDKTVEEVERDIVAWGPGLYAVGLDRHAGLAIVDDEGRAHFIHSSYYSPSTVRSESFRGNNPLADSRYRVFGKLLDDRMIDRWLRAEHFRAR